MSTSKPIHIFKPGRHTAMSGAVLDFTEHDLAASAQAYNPAVHEAPLVVGHPKADAPAYGWVKSLAFAENGLQAEPDQVDAAFAELLQAGRFKKVSASFYTPDSPANPVPGVFYLRHVGFLGAQPPAIKGLKQAEFADEAGCITIEFSETESTDGILPIHEPEPGDTMSEQDKARLAELEAENLRLKQQQADFAEQQKQAHTAAIHNEHVAFAEGLIKEGKLLPAQKDLVIASLDYLAAAETVVEFGEGDDKKPLLSAVKTDWLAKLPKIIEFGEVGAGNAETHHVDFAAPGDYAVDQAALQLHQQAETYQAAHGVDYQTALRAVAKQ